MPATDVQVSVHVVATRNGVGTQDLTDILDRDGNAFVTKLFIFEWGFCGVNALTNDAPTGNNITAGIGMDDGTKGGSFAAGDVYSFLAKIVNGGTGTRYSIIDGSANPFFGGDIFGHAWVSAIGLGTATITWDLKNRDGWVLIVTCIGGDTLSIDVDTGTGNGTYSTSDVPKGLLIGGNGSWNTPLVATTPAAAQYSWGWDTPDGNRSAIAAAMFNQSSNSRALLTDRCAVFVDIAALAGGMTIVSAWSASDYTIAGNTSTLALRRIAFGGATTICKAGTIIQQPGIGIQTFNVDCDPRLLKMVSVGNESDPGLNTDMFQYLSGSADGARQASFWMGETIVGNGTPLTGARYLSNNTILRFGTPAASSTTFDAVAEFVSMTTDGLVTINWTVNDDVPREIAWFVLGTEGSEPPPPPIVLSNAICPVPLPAAVLTR